MNAELSDSAPDPAADPTIRCILFDMGNVLVKFSHEVMFEQVAAVCGCSGSEIRRWLWDSGWQERFERGEIDAAAVVGELGRRVGRSVDVSDVMRAASDIFSLNESLLAVIDRLKLAGYRLVVLSNTCPPHVAWIEEHWDVLKRFDARVFSYEVGAMKPDAVIYETAARVAGCRMTECFFVDDLAENVRAARSLGIRGTVFTDVTGLVEALSCVGIEVSGC
ncbi:MAG: HAD family phosphatase [Planctomycetaceae bacterium]